MAQRPQSAGRVHFTSTNSASRSSPASSPPAPTQPVRPQSAFPTSRPSQARVATSIEEHHIKFFPNIAPLQFAHTDTVVTHLLSLLNDASRLVRTSISLSQVTIPGDILTTEDDPLISDAEQVPLLDCVNRLRDHLSNLQDKPTLHPTQGHYRPNTAPAHHSSALRVRDRQQNPNKGRFSRQNVGLSKPPTRGDSDSEPEKEQPASKPKQRPVIVQNVKMAEVPQPSRPAAAAATTAAPTAASDKPGAAKPGRTGAEAFDFTTELGVGAYGKVVLATKKDTGEQFAAKVLSKTRVIKENKMKYVTTERNLLNLMNHPNLIKLRFTFQDEQRLYFVMELAEGGELTDKLEPGKALPLDVARHYAAEILLGLEHMHSKNVIHRDLKPPNILLDKDGHVKITDFGTAKQLEKGQKSIRKSSFVGSADYVSPELLEEGTEVTIAADFWAWACILYQMLAGRTPFKAPSEFLLFQEICKVNFEYPDNFSPQAKDLISQILVKDASKRAGMGLEGIDEIKDHPFFDGIDWDNLHKSKGPSV